MPDWAHVVDGETEYEDFGTVAYRYVALETLLASIPDPPPPPVFEKIDDPLVTEVVIDRPMSEVYQLISDFSVRLLWNRGVQQLRYEEERMNRAGTKHHCVVGGNLIEFETIKGDSTRVRLEVHYKPRPFPRSQLAPVFRFAFGRRLPGVLASVKEVTEG